MTKIRFWNVSCIDALSNPQTYTIVVTEDCGQDRKVQEVVRSSDKEALQKVCEKHNETLVKILEDFTGKTFKELNEERLNKYSPDSSYLCFFERARD